MNIPDIINKIEHPLLFSSKDGFSHLHLVKNLEKVMMTFIQELQHGLTAETVMGYSGYITGLESLFKDFDIKTGNEKKELIQGALELVDELRKALGKSHEPCEAEGLQGLTEMAFLTQPVQFVKGVGPKMASTLERKNVHTIEDILYFLPRRYEDRRQVKTIAKVTPGAKETVVGRIIDARMQQFRHKKLFEISVNDGTGLLTATWFKGNPAYLKTTFKIDQNVILTGDVRTYNNGRNMIHPDFEILDDQDDQSLHFKRIVPIYSETEGLHQKTLRRMTMRAVEVYAAYVQSPIPKWICEKRQLPPIQESIRAVHFPDTDADIDLLNEGKSIFHRRLIYDEFFFFELGMAMKKQGHIFEEGIAFQTGGPLVKQFYKVLSFNLTGAQRRVIEEIETDMQKNFPMHRLLQGDVGSGKTVVSMAAMVTACENGYQAAIMAPTEILAEQHYRTIQGWTEELGLKAALITGSRKGAIAKDVREDILNGETRVVVGTHALIQDKIVFHNLGFVVIDEQHRFGVMQRAALRAKGKNPDVLVMTATPIPRTLAMTVYGDLDVSVIDELPPGKKPIKTSVFFESQRERVYGIIRGELKKGHQVFVVYPLVEESENLDLKDATRMADQLQNEVFPDQRIGLVHGKMRGRDKDRIMSSFMRKEIDILVATTVIEVGIDIPEASLMVIEHAERFGLSQLHQLRGRVGRSDIPSYCILLSQYSGSEEAKKRLSVMERTNDGFRIAEEDLSIRGPGEFMGTRQSGLPDFRIANILRDGRILGEARTDAFFIANDDPRLEKPEHRLMKEVLMRRWQGRLELAKTG